MKTGCVKRGLGDFDPESLFKEFGRFGGSVTLIHTVTLLHCCVVVLSDNQRSTPSSGYAGVFPILTKGGPHRRRVAHPAKVWGLLPKALDRRLRE
jgi:hypothetical protein